MHSINFYCRTGKIKKKIKEKTFFRAAHYSIILSKGGFLEIPRVGYTHFEFSVSMYRRVPNPQDAWEKKRVFKLNILGTLTMHGKGSENSSS